MKASIHLFYGIIIGVLICACTGSLKEESAGFEWEKIVRKIPADHPDKTLRDLKKDGWTIIDFEIIQDPDRTVPIMYFHVGASASDLERASALKKGK